MVSRGVAAVLALALALSLSVSTAVGATVQPQGLWSKGSTFTGSTIEDVGVGPVELGVRFTTERPIFVTGVRVYRVDNGSLTGSLWAADGVRLTTGAFTAWNGAGWYDLAFAEPVLVKPGSVYVVSYLAPNSRYGYTYNYFTNQSFTVGPVTALASVEGVGNGTYCYPNLTSCVFPNQTFRDSNYWVSPLWTEYRFDGFYEPVSTASWNRAKAGQAIPVKFSLGGDFGLGVLADGRPAARSVACPGTGTPTDPVEATSTAGSSGLSYDATTGTYTYVWKTSKTWANRCVEFDLGLDDGSSRTFLVQFTR